MHRTSNAFTLIELLIVVAIIGVLAAIAIPNFLMAQIKAKVSLTASNMRLIGSALEMYHLDKGTYPRWAWDSILPSDDYSGFRDLTTPVAYLPNSDVFRNPFREKHIRGNYIDYYGNELDPYFELATWKTVDESYFPYEFPRNTWLLESSGPDSIDDYDPIDFPGLGLIYQPSNGIISSGDIYRSGGKGVPSWATALTY